MKDLADPVQSMWVVVRAPDGEVAGVVITRACCANRAARKAVNAAFPDRDGVPREYACQLQGLFPWLLIPEQFRERLLDRGEVAAVNMLLYQQQAPAPTLN